jgi:hypothetical protein
MCCTDIRDNDCPFFGGNGYVVRCYVVNE